MRLKKLTLDKFGPFSHYDISFTSCEDSCILLTGKNNEGKSNIILALKLLGSACKSLGNRNLRIVIEDGHNYYYRLPQVDVEDINVYKLLHNYIGETSTINAVFDDEFELIVVLNAKDKLIYADYKGRIPKDIAHIFGILPPLGPLSEKEEFISTFKYLTKNLNTSLAPRHLRNYFKQLLPSEDYALIQEIVHSTWPTIELLDFEHIIEDNSLKCYYRENRFHREISWAGQGLQIWLQIVTHLVRLRDCSIIVLDEPEINLHPEKQNDLIQVLHDYHKGSSIIATHSVELMNNVNVSHILHVQKSKTTPLVKSTEDRHYLELVRSHVGSNFNLIASQFEKFDLILFTEDIDDFKILRTLANKLGIQKSVFNIPLHGFSEYYKAQYYAEAYNLLIGKKVQYTMLLDRDYYPQEYLDSVRETQMKYGINVCFTPGKEIENLFVTPKVLKALIPPDNEAEFQKYWDKHFDDERIDCLGSFMTLHQKFLENRIDTKTLTKLVAPIFEQTWQNKESRHLVIGGKQALHSLRGYYRKVYGKNLTLNELIDLLIITSRDEIQKFIYDLYQFT